MPTITTVDQYIRSFPPAARTMLKQLRQTIKATVPQAKEMISYRLPFYEYRSPGYKGRMIYFGAFRTHVSIFVVPRRVPVALKKQMALYQAGRSTLQFPLGSRLPLAMIKQLIKIRMKEIDASLVGRTKKITS